MEPAEDRSGNNVLGRNTSHGRQPTYAERWLHAKTAVCSAMIVANVASVANVLLQHSVGLDIIAHDNVIEAIAA